MQPDISTLIYSLNKAGILSSKTSGPIHQNIVNCYYRNNPDGTMRWVWPAGSRHADFLRFHHQQGFTSGMFFIAAKLLAAFGLLKILSDGKFSFFTNKGYDRRSPHVLQSRWAWLAESSLADRKVVIWHRKGSVFADQFIKIPLTGRSEEKSKNEFTQLNLIHKLRLKNIDSPYPINLGDNCMQLTDMGKTTKRINRISDLPFDALIEWLQVGITKTSYYKSDFIKTNTTRINNLQKLYDRIPTEIIDKIIRLNNTTPKTNTFITTLAHGNLTPWNILIKRNKIKLTDLESSTQTMPVLFDLFHFVYQSNILIGNRGYKNIRKELEQLFALPRWKVFINKHGIDILEAERLYLLQNVTYQLETYNEQPERHLQLDWLLKTWNDALSWHLNKAGEMSARRLLLTDLGLSLKNKDHALLNWIDTGIETLPDEADLDMCINRRDAKTLIKELKSHAFISRLNTRKRSFTIHVEIVLTDGTFLHLNLIQAFKHRSTVFLDAAGLLSNSIENKYGFKCPSLIDNFCHAWLINWLNNNTIPTRYQTFFLNISAHEELLLNAALQKKYMLPVNNYKDLFQKNGLLMRMLLKNLWTRPENMGMNKLKNQLNYLFDSALNIMAKKGFMGSFNRVNKHTPFENITHLVKKQIRKKTPCSVRQPMIIVYSKHVA